MPIRMSCDCGRLYQVADKHAGKRIKCPSCGAPHSVPEPEDPGFEVIEDDAEVVEAGLEIVESGPADAAPPEAGGGPKGADKKKRRKKRPPESPVAQALMAQARHQLRQDEMRAQAAGGREDPNDRGWTMFGVHITAGVCAGVGMLFTGLMAMLALA